MSAVLHCYNIEDLRQSARRRLPRAIFDFFDGGAEDEVTLDDNRMAFQRVRLLPKVLQDVATVDMSRPVLGGPSRLPLIVAPTGGIGMGWPGADIAIARVAASMGIPYTLSTNATASIEEIADRAPGRLWFQLYVLQDRSFMERLIARAQAAGYEALVPTVDLAVGGKRERDFRNGFTTRFRPRLRHFLGAMLRPAWSLRILANGGLPDFVNVRGYRGSEQSGMQLASSVARDTDPSFDWEGLARLRDRWKAKLIVKGVSRVDDARRLLGLGVDGIWVSNHGGRQLDGAVASLDAMASIAAEVGDRAAVIMDGGVRRGSDVFKAIALGGQAVAIGRALLYGVAVAGEQGARHALDILVDELKRTMQLCGTRRVGEIGTHLLADPRRAAMSLTENGDPPSDVSAARLHSIAS